MPDGLLQVLPLHALPGPDGPPLIDTLELVQLGSARALIRSTTPGSTARPPSATALVVGAPDFASAGGATSRLAARSAQALRFAPLPGALRESRRVAAALTPSHRTELLTGARASKAALLRARSPTLLHVATHGFLLDDPTRPDNAGGDPLVTLARAGLALAHAGASGEPAQGLLTALEAASLDLRSTRLVVLSACETALGQTARNDGVYGLVRAFHEAGAQAVLGTLWPVSDDGTIDFMDAFYARLSAGPAPASALQETQRAFARDARWSHPRYWAGFVVSGR